MKRKTTMINPAISPLYWSYSHSLLFTFLSFLPFAFCSFHFHPVYALSMFQVDFGNFGSIFMCFINVWILRSRIAIRYSLSPSRVTWTTWFIRTVMPTLPPHFPFSALLLHAPKLISAVMYLPFSREESFGRKVACAWAQVSAPRLFMIPVGSSHWTPKLQGCLLLSLK